MTIIRKIIRKRLVINFPQSISKANVNISCFNLIYIYTAETWHLKFIDLRNYNLRFVKK